MPAPGEHRKGVPQGRHVHGFLPRGEEVFDELFPGLTQQLVDAGAVVCDLFGTARYSPSGRCRARASTGLRGLQASRPFLEGHVRQRMRQLTNVALVDGCDVVGLTATDDRNRVTGVRVLRRADGSAEEVPAADLVLDATGRASRVPLWLEALGYPRPAEEKLRIGVGYASCQVRLSPAVLGDDKFIVVGARPDRPTEMVLFAIEGERWILTLLRK